MSSAAVGRSEESGGAGLGRRPAASLQRGRGGGSLLSRRKAKAAIAVPTWSPSPSSTSSSLARTSHLLPLPFTCYPETFASPVITLFCRSLVVVCEFDCG